MKQNPSPALHSARFVSPTASIRLCWGCLSFAFWDGKPSGYQPRLISYSCYLNNVIKSNIVSTLGSQRVINDTPLLCLVNSLVSQGLTVVSYGCWCIPCWMMLDDWLGPRHLPVGNSGDPSPRAATTSDLASSCWETLHAGFQARILGDSTSWCGLIRVRTGQGAQAKLPWGETIFMNLWLHIFMKMHTGGFVHGSMKNIMLTFDVNKYIQFIFRIINVIICMLSM